MQWRNTGQRYGLLSIALHWGMAAAVIGMFALGLWMVELNYYSAWYQSAPALHKSIGLLLFFLLAVRLFWRFISPPPAALASHSRLIRIASGAGHAMLYLGLLALMVSGYLISTANDRGVDLFGWLTIPALISGLPGQADNAGLIHRYTAWALIILSGVHALAALKHHLIDRDRTLLRMLGR